MHEYGIKLTPISMVKDVDCIIVAVAHNEFKDLNLLDVKSMYKPLPDNEKVLIDVKGIYSVKELKESGMTYWRL